MGNDQQAGIGDRLIEEGTLTKDDLLMALSDGGLDGTDLAKAIESAKTVTREELAEFFESASSTPKIPDLREIPFASDASQLITEESARRHLVVPLCKAGGIMFVVMGSNLDAYSVNELRAETKGPIKLVRGQAAQVKAAIDKVYRRGRGDSRSGRRHGSSSSPCGGRRTVGSSPGLQRRSGARTGRCRPP